MGLLVPAAGAVQDRVAAPVGYWAAGETERPVGLPGAVTLTDTDALAVLRPLLYPDTAPMAFTL